MNFFKKINEILNINNNIPNDEKFKEMSKEELTNIASILTDENKQLKEKMNLIMNENNLLKNSIINNSNEKNSEFGKFYNDLKETFLNFNEDDDNNREKNLNNFKSFLYNQYLFYGGIEEDDVNFINQININNDEDWEKNQEIFLFKQKILERNYNEIFRNLLISKEINNLIGGKKNINNNFNNENNENKFNVNQMKQNEEKIIKDNNNNNNFNNNNFNNFNNLIKEEKVFNEENQKNSSNKNENKNIKKTNSNVHNSSKKKENNDLLYDLIYEDEDEKLSFSNLTEEKKGQKSKWDEE